MGRPVITRDGFLSANETALRLRCTSNNLVNLRKKGILIGEYDRQGRRWWYAVDEVVEAVRLYKESKPPDRGEIAAQAFESFRAGKSLQDVVIALRIPVAEARTLLQQYDPGLLFFTERDHEIVRALLVSRGFRGAHAPQICEAIRELCARDARLLKLTLDEDHTAAPEPPPPRVRNRSPKPRAKRKPNGAAGKKRSAAR